MKLDKRSLNRILSLDDEKLADVIRSVAAESGLDLRSFGISEDDIASVRKALSSATDEDIQKAAEQIEAYKKRS